MELQCLCYQSNAAPTNNIRHSETIRKLIWIWPKQTISILYIRWRYSTNSYHIRHRLMDWLRCFSVVNMSSAFEGGATLYNCKVLVVHINSQTRGWFRSANITRAIVINPQKPWGSFKRSKLGVQTTMGLIWDEFLWISFSYIDYNLGLQFIDKFF